MNAFTREILFFPREQTIYIFELTCNFLVDKNTLSTFIWQLCTQTESCEAAGDVMNILSSENMGNTPLRSRMQFRMNFASGVISSKILMST